MPVRSLLAPLALAAALLASGTAAAQSPEIVRAQAGDWLVASDDGRPGCRVRLETKTTVGGYVASPAADCAARVPALAGVAAWRFADGVTLADATRKPVMIFGEDETGTLKTRTGGPPAWYLLKAKAGVDRMPHASALFGTWVMRRPNGPAICTVSLLDRPPKGGEESYALLLDAGCDAAVRRLELVSWRIEDGYLMLEGSGDGSLRLEAASFGFEKAAGEAGRPLHLVRRP